ncbi:MAG: hypothetical protein IJJ34_03710 [Clostridia bacterium]|nr:hypothetical protein [Clostridia bacterium]
MRLLVFSFDDPPDTGKNKTAVQSYPALLCVGQCADVGYDARRDPVVFFDLILSFRQAPEIAVAESAQCPQFVTVIRKSLCTDAGGGEKAQRIVASAFAAVSVFDVFIGIQSVLIHIAAELFFVSVVADAERFLAVRLIPQILFRTVVIDPCSVTHGERPPSAISVAFIITEDEKEKNTALY